MAVQLTTLEKEILKIAENLASVNKLITIDAIFQAVKRYQNESEEKTSHAIYKLILLKYIVPGSKMTKNQVLENENRNKIYEFILKNPGCHLSEIKDVMNIKGQLAKWHLFILEKFGFIFSIRYLKYLTFFSKSFNEDLINPYLSLKNENSYKIFKILWENPVLNIDELRILLPFQLPTLKYHLNKLIESNVVKIQNINNDSYYLLDPEILSALQELLKISLADLKSYFHSQEEFIREKF